MSDTRLYAVTLNHDHGTTTIVTAARNGAVAADLVLRAERAPRAALVHVRLWLTVVIDLPLGLVSMTSGRHYVDLTWHHNSHTRTRNGFSGPGRYLAAQATLREWRAQAARELDAREQLARIP